MKLSQLTLICIVLILPGCSQQQKIKVIKLGHGLDATHPVHEAMKYMSRRLEQHSSGQMTIKIYPSSQLGGERELLELMQIGSLGMTKVSSGVLENFAPSMKILGLPYLFGSREHSFRVFDSDIGQQLLSESEQFWLKGLGFYDAGSRSFYTKDRPVYKPEDLDGLKVRVMQSQSSMEMVQALGGSPTPISWSELYSSLQQGVVDGAENNPPSFYLSHHYEVCKYYIIDEHTAVPDVLLISTIIWNKLNPDEKEWLQLAAKESIRFQRKIWLEAEQEAMEAVEAAGVEIIYPDKQPFIDKVQSMYDPYEKNPETSEILRKIAAMK